MYAAIEIFVSFLKIHYETLNFIKFKNKKKLISQFSFSINAINWYFDINDYHISFIF